nr:MAG TPA: hypothetical protein [Caudoviricetes sp.]
MRLNAYHREDRESMDNLPNTFRLLLTPHFAE